MTLSSTATLQQLLRQCRVVFHIEATTKEAAARLRPELTRRGRRWLYILSLSRRREDGKPVTFNWYVDTPPTQEFIRRIGTPSNNIADLVRPVLARIATVEDHPTFKTYDAEQPNADVPPRQSFERYSAYEESRSLRLQAKRFFGIWFAAVVSRALQELTSLRSKQELAGDT